MDSARDRQSSNGVALLLVSSALLVAAMAVMSMAIEAAATVAVPKCQGETATIWGTNGDDVLTGTNKKDVIAGLGGNDTIRGLRGNDVICGGTGADTIVAGKGQDSISGGTGGDSISPGPGNDAIDGGNGIDLVTFAASPSAVTVSLVKGTASGGWGNESISDVEDIVGSDSSDTLTGDSGPNTIVGRSGGDDIDGKAGADHIFGSGGSDDIVGGKGVDTVEGGGGDDHLEGNGQSDVLRGGNGIDTLQGQGGSDDLSGGKGTDTLEGGGGSDLCIAGELNLDCESGLKSFAGGTWTVPGEVSPGFYRNSTSSSGCYWARLSGFGGSLDDIIANEFTYDRDIVEITGEEKGFESSSCGTWTNDIGPIKAPGANFGGGAFLVTYEIKPGLWRNSSSANGCYWERTTGFTNELGEIIANSFSYTIQTVQISSSDFGFTSSGCGTWTRIGN